MKSTIEKIYDRKDEIDILNKRVYPFGINPFYKVSSFITDIDPDLIKNFAFNLENLKISEENNHCANYDYVNNVIYATGTKDDIFSLFHMASNDREKKYTGIISEEGNGYGLNNGLTELFTKMVSRRRLVYPIEATVSNTLLMLDKEIVSESYFNNDASLLKLISSSVNDLMVLVDKYHDNYIELITLYEERFIRNRFYHNAIYGRELKEKDQKLKELNSRIFKLEYDNFGTMYDIFDLLENLIIDSKLKVSEKLKIITNINEEFNKIFCSEDFRYLYEFTDSLEKGITPKRLIR